jgi:GNAT superfamily N-acetyltransferase
MHRRALPEHFASLTRAKASEQVYWQKTLADPDSHTVLAFHEGRLIGFASAVLRPASPVTNYRTCHLRSIAVREDSQRAGTGRVLVRAIEDWACENGAGEVDLLVYRFNSAARAFYRRLGYDVRADVLTKRL